MQKGPHETAPNATLSALGSSLFIFGEKPAPSRFSINASTLIEGEFKIDIGRRIGKQGMRDDPTATP